MRSTLAVLAGLALAPSVLAQSTAFTYQGRLKNGGALASGLHDLRFRLFDAATGGAQVGTTQCADNILIVEGLFTATIDFGQRFANTTPRFLEIDVRADTGLDCTNATGFTLLSGRQLITAAPMAAHANSAFSLDSPDGTHLGALVVDNSGRIGIGTAAPTHSVHIANPAPTLALQDTDSAGTAGGTQVGYVSYRDNGNVERGWIGYGSGGDPDLSIVNARPSGDIVLLPFAGNVGINTGSPTAMLDVRGEIRYGPQGQYRPAAGEEPLRIIRGRVDANGTLQLGSGFTVTHDGTGTYTVHFTTPFTGAPVVTANQGSYQGDVGVGSATTGTVRIDLYNMAWDPINDSFSFIAIGPR